MEIEIRKIVSTASGDESIIITVRATNAILAAQAISDAEKGLLDAEKVLLSCEGERKDTV